MHLVEGRELHVVAEFSAEVGVGIGRDGRFEAIEIGRFEGKCFALVDGVVVRNAGAVIELFGWPKFGEETQHGEYEAVVETIDGGGFANELLGVELGVFHHLVDETEGSVGEPEQGEWHLFVREDVDIDAAIFENAVVVVGFGEEAAGVAHFGEAKEIARVGFVGLEFEVRGKFCGQNFEETLVVFTHHFYIKVVVPRNVTSVANAAEEGTGTKPIAYVVFSADAVDFAEHFGHAILHAAQGRTVGIELRFESFGIERGF